MAQLSGTEVFSDNFKKDGKLNSDNWEINKAYYGEDGKYNPAFLGQTFIRQELPDAANGMARIRMDTWNAEWKDGKSFYGSEAITKGAWDAQSTGGVGFEARMKFEGTQGGMIAGMFFYQQFTYPPGPGNRRVPHNELDWEILTSQLRESSKNKISTNVFTHEAAGNSEKDYPISYPVTQIKKFSPNDWHTYRIEWLPTKVIWLIDGKVIRTETTHLPQANVKQQLHLNLWGTPAFPPLGPWGPSPGDRGGPNVSDPTLVPATNANPFNATTNPGGNKTYFFDVDYVKVEELSTRLGSQAAEFLVGSLNNDGIDGGGGTDTLSGKAGHDTIWGGDGDDAIRGGLGDDTIHGEGHHDTLLGGDGNDSIDGGAGDDTIDGGDGNDSLNGGDDRDIIEGGAGDDWIGGGGGNDVIAGGGGNDRVQAGLGDDIVDGALGDDTIHGDAGNDTVFGGAGNDTIDGWTGQDTLLGGSGDDWIAGGDGDDDILAGSGNDRLAGGTGDDNLTGGAGNDAFLFSSIADSLVAAGDWIRDWEEGDKVDLRGIDANSLVAGDQAFTLIGAAEFSGAGQLRVFATDNTIIQGDINGDGAADFRITVAGVHALNNHSFAL
ncbi:MAG: family 16 glycosylhydrolase [Enhydrobacter sp.]|nr:family 16 glycosylhydrolase [Enhydrobacter sp.]